MMEFPVYLRVGSIRIHPHWVFESLAYLIGFRFYLRMRAQTGDHLDSDQRMWIVAATIAGGAIGSKVLYWFTDPMLTVSNWNNLYYLMAGKTIVGGLIGGLIAVEWTKRRLGITRRTGDLFAVPLAVGIAVGRIGCFLSGLQDQTYGKATSLPWGVDFGDGIARHPTQLYEFLWLGLLAYWLHIIRKRPQSEGDLFKGFMIGYLGFRLLVDFLKPEVSLAGLTAIQWACLAMLVYYRRDLLNLLRFKEASSL
jgi:prolipoprotein diacylglyceryltransferase